MRILVTGSAGHLGEALVRTLDQHGHEPIGVDLLASPFTRHVGSITERKLVARWVEGVDAILHTATLHKPHVVTHTTQDFIDTNVTGTLNLLEEAASHGVSSFIFTSTTSTFGDAMRPATGDSAVWVTEELTPVPRNIYGVTKAAAEDLCQLAFKRHGLPCLVLRTSRFFPEEDDHAATRNSYEDGNIKANEFLYRRVEIEDVVNAHLCALKRVPEIGFDRFIISATTPFLPEDLGQLGQDATTVLERRVPGSGEVYRKLGWRMFPTLGRVYVNQRARERLSWQPGWDFERVLDCLDRAVEPRSELARTVGAKGYHRKSFDDGPFPVE